MCPTLNSTTTSTTAAEPPTLKGKWARTVKTTAAPGVCVCTMCVLLSSMTSSVGMMTSMGPIRPTTCKKGITW